MLSFSGGGTRAAAFSYGVLEELRRTEITVDGQRRRLIDEVDIITGVSGGSFTALAYALHGERLGIGHDAEPPYFELTHGNDTSSAPGSGLRAPGRIPKREAGSP